MKLSVIILNYNVRFFLELCLVSVKEAIKDLDAEIIVVDNDSPDDSCDMVKTKFPDVQLMENDVNVGFSKGNNQGVDLAKGEYICILNPDTVVSENTFKDLLDFAESKDKLGAVGCKLIDGTGTFLLESKRNIPYPKVSLMKLLGNSNKYYANHIKKDEIGEIEILVGAFMFMKKDTYEKLGGFDEEYFMYGEDIDLSYRLLKHGYSNYYYGKTTVLHYKGESTLKDKVYAKRFYGAMQTFYKKHFRMNLFSDFLVWLGLKAAYLMRTKTDIRRNIPKKYYYIGRDNGEKLNSVLPQKVLVSNFESEFENGSELIFDNNQWSFKKILKQMEEINSTHEDLSFKILPKNTNFIIGSDDSINRGEFIIFETE